MDEATSGAEAPERIASTSYDCLLLDHYLRDAHELSPVLRIRASSPHLPIVTVTGRGDGDAALELMTGRRQLHPEASLKPERLAAGLRRIHPVKTVQLRSVRG